MGTIRQCFGENISELISYKFSNKVGLIVIKQIDDTKIIYNFLNIERSISLKDICLDLNLDYYEES